MVCCTGRSVQSTCSSTQQSSQGGLQGKARTDGLASEITYGAALPNNCLPLLCVLPCIAQAASERDGANPFWRRQTRQCHSTEFRISRRLLEVGLQRAQQSVQVEPTQMFGGGWEKLTMLHQMRQDQQPRITTSIARSKRPRNNKELSPRQSPRKPTGRNWRSAKNWRRIDGRAAGTTLGPATVAPERLPTAASGILIASQGRTSR